MAIIINPNRVNIPTGGAGKARTNREPVDNAAPIIIPRRAQENLIPSPETLRTLVTGAVEALRRGIRWDRGTILNVLA